ncbi:MAG TPA: zincin-like metallopeptidase domain-containing protein [Casimicrobiaceae bacterium]|jgi:antirestriction protein ArdC|nr:zincin-like metallopeptidase domain-containing protein [Casimicrobiaceae bacterium]
MQPNDCNIASHIQEPYIWDVALHIKEIRPMPINSNYQLVTDRIVALLEQGTAPWRQPWDASSGPAIASGRPLRVGGQPYRGVNTVNLWCAAQARGYRSPYWLTLKAAQAFGAHVRKGERAECAFFVGQATRTNVDENTGEESEDSFSFLKSYAVFNAEQIEDLPDQYYVPTLAPAPLLAGRHPVADAFVAASGATVRHGGDKAFYSPSLDYLQMPAPGAFAAPEAYYSVLLHELTHWTSAPARCDRVLGRRFGDHAYAAEELVAELGAAFLCADLGVTVGEPRADHASYVASWIKVLKSDNRAVFRAAALAERAATYLHELADRADAPAPQPDPAPQPPKPRRPRQPAPAPVAPPARPQPRANVRPHWTDHSGAAWAACKAEHGPDAWAGPGVVWLDLAPAARSWLSPDKVRVRWSRSQCLPAPQYWPAGTFPAHLQLAPRPARRHSPADSLRDARARACAAAFNAAGAVLAAHDGRAAKVQALAGRGATEGERAAAAAALGRITAPNIPAFCATWRASDAYRSTPGFDAARPDPAGVAFYVRHGFDASWLDAPAAPSLPAQPALPIAA